MHTPERSFSCICSFPDDINKVLIGAQEGLLYIAQLEDLESKKKLFLLQRKESISCIKSIKIIDLRKSNIQGNIRGITILDKNNLIGISHYGGIFIINANSLQIKILQNEIISTMDRLWRILVIDSEKFITVGSYGKMQLWKKVDAVWQNIVEKRHRSDSFFCLNWYNRTNNQIITNDYRGVTEVWDTDLNLKATNMALGSNLQEILLDRDKLITVSYRGDTVLYKIINDKYVQIDQYNCSGFQSPSVLRRSGSRDGYIAGFLDNIFLFNSEFDEFQRINIHCKDILKIKDYDLILTSRDLCIYNPSYLVVPENYIKYKYM